MNFPLGADAEEYFSGHVVPDNPYYRNLVEAGLTCPACSRRFQIWLWPKNQVVVECGCKCVCHRTPEQKQQLAKMFARIGMRIQSNGE